MNRSAWAEESAVSIRLQARHTGAPLNRHLLREFEESSLVLSAQEIVEIYEQGLSDRAAGIRCLCARCELDYQRIQSNEILRVQYRSRRLSELRAAGFNEDDIEQRVTAEIASGAALRGATHEEAGS